MFITIAMSIASTGACVVFAVVVWLRLRSNKEPIQQKPEPHREGTNRAVMQSGDWANAAVNVVIGVLRGIVINALVQLRSTGLWSVAVLLGGLAAGLFFVESWFGGMFDKVFPSGIRQGRKYKKVRKARPAGGLN